ncbi:MAG: hypothetical protein QM820_27625 [Minicystis sp.]
MSFSVTLHPRSTRTSRSAVPYVCSNVYGESYATLAHASSLRSAT